MEPLRRCQTSQHFHQDKGWYLPCNAGDYGAEKMTLMDVPEKLLKCPDVTYEDFCSVLDRGGGATVGPDELKQFEDWTEQFGQEG